MVSSKSKAAKKLLTKKKTKKHRKSRVPTKSEAEIQIRKMYIRKMIKKGNLQLRNSNHDQQTRQVKHPPHHLP